MVETVKLTFAESQVFATAKDVDPSVAKAMRKAMWSRIREKFGIPKELKLKVQCTDPHGLNYLVVCEKNTGMPVGSAKSRTPYGCAPIDQVIPFLNCNWAAASALPTHAQPVGGGLFVCDGNLYFPNY